MLAGHRLEVYDGPIYAILVMAGLLIGIVWLINKTPRWFSRRREMEERNRLRNNTQPTPHIKHRRYRFDDQDRIIGHDDD